MTYCADRFGKRQAEKFAKGALNNGLTEYTKHAQKRMKQRDLTIGDINNVLNRGKVVDIGRDELRQCYTYLISTKTIQVPVSFKEVQIGDEIHVSLVVVSCWRLNKRGYKAR